MDVEGHKTSKKSRVSTSSLSSSLSNLSNTSPLNSSNKVLENSPLKRTSPRFAKKSNNCENNPSTNILKRKHSIELSPTSKKGKEQVKSSSSQPSATSRTSQPFTRSKRKRISFTEDKPESLPPTKSTFQQKPSNTMPKKQSSSKSPKASSSSAPLSSPKSKPGRRFSRRLQREHLNSFELCDEAVVSHSGQAKDTEIKETKVNEDTLMDENPSDSEGHDDAEDDADENTHHYGVDDSENDEDDDHDHDHDEEDEDDTDYEHDHPSDEEGDIDDDDHREARMFSGALSGGIRALGNYASGISARLRTILANLRNHEDPSIQLIALQDLAELLSVATEDTIAGTFSPDAFVRELVGLMRGGLGPFGDEDNPEVMLLACRCLSNMMEAMPSSANAVVYGGAVPVLCSKLLEIQYIDLAEQALSTLEKLSQDFPASIVREGGLTAVLMYLDFFSTNVQRTAVTTAANSCRNVPADCLSMVKEVMPNIQTILQSPDQKVLDQACLCVVRIIESFKHNSSHMESLISPELLTQINQIILNSSTIITNSTFIHLLRSLAHIARSSPKLTFDLLKMNIGNTLFQVMTGLSPDVVNNGITTSSENEVFVLQSLVHRPKDQIAETLNIIGELMPSLPKDGIFNMKLEKDLKGKGQEDQDKDTSIITSNDASSSRGPSESSRKDVNKDRAKRIELVQSHVENMKIFASLLVPVLVECFLSTVNTQVRQRVVNALLKMIVHLQPEVLADVLLTVSFASFLASIFSQQDQPSILIGAIQMSTLLMQKLPNIYHYHFCREGVMHEILKLAKSQLDVTVPSDDDKKNVDEKLKSVEPVDQGKSEKNETRKSRQRSSMIETDSNLAAISQTAAGQRLLERLGFSVDAFNARMSEKGGILNAGKSREWIAVKAKEFCETYIDSADVSKEDFSGDVSKPDALLRELAITASEISKTQDAHTGLKKLAHRFTTEESIFSFELQQSGVIDALLRYLSDDLPEDKPKLIERQHAFLNAFLVKPSEISDSSVTPLAALIKRLQESLSRSEPFEVATAYQSALDESRRNPLSILTKQIRLKLVAADGTDVQKAFSGFIVSIHAIATFKALDDYLKPKLSSNRSSNLTNSSSILSGLMSGSASRLSNALAAFAGIAAPPASESTSPTQAERTEEISETIGLDSHGDEDEDEDEEDEDEDEEDGEDDSQHHEESTSEDEEEDENNIILTADLDETRREDTPGDSGTENLTNLNPSDDGSKMVATKDDGTCIATLKGSASASMTSLTPSGSSARNEVKTSTSPSPTPTSAPSRSYAAAVRGDDNWHLEFSVNNNPINLQTTIYKAIHEQGSCGELLLLRNVWSGIHTVKFKKVPGPQPRSHQQVEESRPSELDSTKLYVHILKLLRILYDLNSRWQEICIDADSESTRVNPLKPSCFVNAKLTAKLNRQLEEPLIVASSCLPSWTRILAHEYPFLFPFETRYLYLQSTSFGYARSMSRWQSQAARSLSPSASQSSRRQEAIALLGRMQRQKVRIIRNRMLESAVKVMELYGSSQSMLEVEYFDEVGTGLGPTLEFYANVSREFAQRKLGMWREDDSISEYIFSKSGLFPRPFGPGEHETVEGKKVLNLFKTLGIFVAKALLDSRLVDISFNPVFMRLVFGEQPQKSVRIVQEVDMILGNSLKLVNQFIQQKSMILTSTELKLEEQEVKIHELKVQGVKVEDLALDFTLPGYAIELVEGGEERSVSIDNIEEYFDLVVEYTLLRGVKAQVNAFSEGFSMVFSKYDMKAFNADELVMIFGNSHEDWSEGTLIDSLKADHGYTMESKAVRDLVQIMSEFNLMERRALLQFITGSPKLPIGGFKSLNPSFTIVCKTTESSLKADDYLPSVMTCVNYLKLPNYSSKEVMKERLAKAMVEGQDSFHLS